MTVTTWADGFGLWHARVDETDNAIGNTAAAERAARKAIRDELQLRGRDGFDRSRVRVRMTSRMSRDGVLSTEFAEV